ncbi:acetoacetate decarboxylase family protein [Vibrio sp. SCSIO 43137]|uniref:acetoacetate decarboxylase family protein n=1 Tax=Vibrio sp. SCSIO 43137 TaxID=3021011 RepID=UPI002FE0E4B7
MKRTSSLWLILMYCFFSVTSSYAADTKSDRRFTYYENDGVFLYYETKNSEAYRELLPSEFDMPDNLYINAFIADFYKMDARTEPYKEASIFLLAKYQGREIWHCIFMPVTSEQSRRAGIRRLGFPKTMGEISFSRNVAKYEGKAITEDNREMILSVDTDGYQMSEEERVLIDQLSVLPRMNILSGNVIEMKRNRRKSILTLANRAPDKINLIAGKGSIEFKSESSGTSFHALDLAADKVLAAYYLKNSIPFRLGKK